MPKFVATVRLTVWVELEVEGEDLDDAARSIYSMDAEEEVLRPGMIDRAVIEDLSDIQEEDEEEDK